MTLPDPLPNVPGTERRVCTERKISGSETAELLAAALEARERAYAPYSHFFVGAAILASDGRIFSGCNIENASYGATICAERVAAGTAIAAGVRNWKAIAVATCGGIAPCGLCRQFLVEFAPQSLVLLLDSHTRHHQVTSLAELIPLAFTKHHLDSQPISTPPLPGPSTP